MVTIINIVNSLATLYSLTVLRCDIQKISFECDNFYVGYVDVKDKEGYCSSLKILDNGRITVIEK